jgi:hypothetical protein
MSACYEVCVSWSMLLFVICLNYMYMSVICCYLMRICAITYYYKVVVGPGSQICTLLEVWVLGVGMSTLDAQMGLYAEDRGLQVPMSLEHFQIDMFRPIRVDHTNCLQVDIKIHSFVDSITQSHEHTFR